MWNWKIVTSCFVSCYNLSLANVYITVWMKIQPFQLSFSSNLVNCVFYQCLHLTEKSNWHYVHSLLLSYDRHRTHQLKTVEKFYFIIVIFMYTLQIDTVVYWIRYCDSDCFCISDYNFICDCYFMYIICFRGYRSISLLFYVYIVFFAAKAVCINNYHRFLYLTFSWWTSCLTEGIAREGMMWKFHILWDKRLDIW